jgi:hypothetical protein
MSQINPYEPPRSQVADVGASSAPGRFVESGRSVDAAHGWSWIASGFGLFRKRAGVWVVVAIILVVIVIALSVVPIVGAIINMLLMPVFVGGLLLGCRALEDDGDFGVGQLFAGFSHKTGRLITIGALSLVAWIVIMIPLVFIMGKSFFALMSGDPSAIIAVGPVVAVGFLVTLGLSVPLYMALWFAPSLVVFHDAEAMQALGQSFRACLKNIVPFLVYSVIVMVLALVAAIPFGLGFLVLLPVLIASLYTAYRDIFHAPE